MKIKYFAALLVLLAELSIADVPAWLADHCAPGRIVAALMGDTIGSGDRNGLNPH